MPPQQTFNSQNLPTRQQNLIYILILIASPIINLLVNSLIYSDFHKIALRGTHEFGLFDWIFGASSFLFGCVLFLLGLNLSHTLLAHRQRHVRKSLFAFGLFSSLYLIINLFTITYGIYKFKVQSFPLIGVSICVYLSLNIIFIFWYWFIDYPSQVRKLHQPETIPELCFPQHSYHPDGWLPNIFSYLYFAILTSNTLGPPEDHSPAGQNARVVVLLHSSLMLIVLVIFVSRAINTLT
jgi:hypothetical protein